MRQQHLSHTTVTAAGGGGGNADRARGDGPVSGPVDTTDGEPSPAIPGVRFDVEGSTVRACLDLRMSVLVAAAVWILMK